MQRPNQMREIRALEAARAMSDFVNAMGRVDHVFLEKMARDHRTLQESFTDLCFGWIKTCSAKLESGNYDLRNEHSVKKCAEILNKVDLDGPPIL